MDRSTAFWNALKSRPTTAQVFPRRDIWQFSIEIKKEREEKMKFCYKRKSRPTTGRRHSILQWESRAELPRSKQNDEINHYMFNRKSFIRDFLDLLSLLKNDEDMKQPQ